MSLRTVYARQLTLNAYSNTIPRLFFLYMLFLRNRCVADLSLDYVISLNGHFPSYSLVGLSARIYTVHYRLSVGEMS
jgi:hypothetical protein